MGYLKYARPALLIAFVALFLLVIHPFTRTSVVVTDVSIPASLLIKQGDLLDSINGNKINTITDYENFVSDIEPNDSVTIVVQRETFPYSYKNFTHMFVAEEKDDTVFLGLSVKETDFSKLTFSHSLVGGNKFVIISEQDNAVDVIKTRLNLNKIYDYSITQEGDTITLVTSAGEEINDIIETKGEFYAKIGENTFFTTDDIKDICINGVNCVLNLYAYQNTSKTENSILWKYGFESTISKEAGQKFIEITKDLSIASCELESCVLNATIDYYIDGKIIGSEEIYAENKGLPYEKPTIGGATLTKDDAMKLLYFTQSMLKGELDAEIKEIEPIETTSFNFSIFVYIMFGIVLASGIFSVLLLKKIKVALIAIALGFSEIIIVLGSLTGLNVLISYATIAGLIVVSLITFAYQGYISYKVKKEGKIKSKIIEISKKMNNMMMIFIVVAFVLVLIIPSFTAPIMVHLITVFLLTKSLFFKTVETA